MKGLVRLALRWLLHHRVRSVLLVLCLALTFLLPITVHHLVRSQGGRMQARARATPLVVGAPGSRYDLVLGSLYFRGRTPAATTMRELARIETDGRGAAVPLLVRHSARGQPLVGTTYDYYERRGLVPQAGRLPALLGEAVLGAAAARRLGLAPGGRLLTDGQEVFELGLAYPLRLSIVGVLAEAGSPDDEAVFTDIRTTWLVEGLLHGHAPATQQEPARVLGHAPDGAAQLDSGVVQWSEVTPETLETFHPHGDVEDMPVTGILVWPGSARGRTVLEGRYAVAHDAQMLQPLDVVDELLGFVAALKAFFDAQTLLVALTTGLLLVLVVALTVRTRARELTTLRRIGVARARVVALLGIELAAVLLAAGVLAFVGAWFAARWLERGLGLVA